MKRRDFLQLGWGVPFIFHFPVRTDPTRPVYYPKAEQIGTGDLKLLTIKKGSKVNTCWTKKEVLDVRSVLNYVPDPAPKLSRFGGNKNSNKGGSGFFRTKQFYERWWLIDPEGHLFISTGFNSIKVPDGYTEKITGILRDSGVSTIGCWSQYEKLRGATAPLPYSVSLNFMKSFMDSRPKVNNHGPGWKRRYPNLTISAFDPDFAKFADAYAKKKIGSLKEDPYCIGYYSDNELPFLFDALDRYLELPDEDHGHQEAKEWMNRNGKSQREEISYTDRMGFLEHLANTYYSICNKYIKKYDPNHLYLGSRLHGYDISLLKSTTNYPVFKAAGRHADVVSVNLYGTTGLSSEEINRFGHWAGKPIQITEFYAKGMDSGLENNDGAGRIVPSQEDRGVYYQNFTLSLLQSKVCVGWDWHRYIDPETSNKGLVNKDHELYRPFQEKVKELNFQRYALIEHFNGYHNSQEIIQRQDSYRIWKDGAPFTIKGQIGLKNLDRLIDANGNTVKIYSDYSHDLEYINAKNIKVLYILDLKDFAAAVIGNHMEKLEREKKKILQTIRNLKNDPSIMIWGLGDNIELTFSPRELRPYWTQLKNLTDSVKQIDPNHPVITSIMVGYVELIEDISAYVSSLDGIGINVANMEKFEQIPEILDELNWRKPYMITEFNIESDCDILHAPFDIPSWSECGGCSVFEESYRKVVMNHPQCLGAFMIT